MSPFAAYLKDVRVDDETLDTVLDLEDLSGRNLSVPIGFDVPVSVNDEDGRPCPLSELRGRPVVLTELGRGKVHVAAKAAPPRSLAVFEDMERLLQEDRQALEDAREWTAMVRRRLENAERLRARLILSYGGDGEEEAVREAEAEYRRRGFVNEVVAGGGGR